MSDLDGELKEALAESESHDEQGGTDRGADELQGSRDEQGTAQGRVDEPGRANEPGGAEPSRADEPGGVVRDEKQVAAPDRRRNLGLLAALLVVGGGILTLVFTSFDSAAIYSVSTDKLLSSPAEFEGRTVRVEGDLVKGTLRHRAEPCEYRFVMEKNGTQLPVRYPECVVPDTFRDVPDMDVQVTAEGQLHRDGYLEASHIMAKCPSKYEMQQKAQKGEAAPHAAIGTAPEAPPIID